MSSEFDIVEVQPVTLAVTEAFVAMAEIPQRIPGMFDLVYGWLPASGLERTGNDYAVYDRFTQDEMRLRAGFQVSERFSDSEKVQCTELPGGRAAHVTHRGSYGGLADANTRLYEWCVEQSLDMAGICWERYGEWSEDESKLVTDIYILLNA